jgi:hypothetical protein
MMMVVVTMTYINAIYLTVLIERNKVWAFALSARKQFWLAE